MVCFCFISGSHVSLSHLKWNRRFCFISGRYKHVMEKKLWILEWFLISDLWELWIISNIFLCWPQHSRNSGLWSHKDHSVQRYHNTRTSTSSFWVLPYFNTLFFFWVFAFQKNEVDCEHNMMYCRIFASF